MASRLFRSGVAGSNARSLSASAAPRKKLETIGVVGSGQMGAGICQVAARRAELQVLMFDLSEDNLNRARNGIETRLKKYVSRGDLSEKQLEAAMGRLVPCTDFKRLSEAQFVIEAATENVDVKLDIFRKLEELTDDNVILASNTSSISIGKIASCTQRADKVVGMHFFNPVHVLDVVELIPGLETSEQTLKVTRGLCKTMGKQIAMASDSPGFIANRLLMPYINEAINMVGEGVAEPADIDELIVNCSPKKMGPLRTADLIGLDTCYSIMSVLHKELGDDKYRPSVLLKNYVDAGRLGVKSGRGFYTYEQTMPSTAARAGSKKS